MGTSGRSKAFHDVCWKNLRDAGFPDRIAWIKAAAAKHPEMDLTRVGHLRRLGGRPERPGGAAVARRFLPGRRRRLRLPRQPHGQDLVERTVDGLAGRPALRRELERRPCPPAAGPTDADRRRTGPERRSGLDDAGGQCAGEGRQGLRPGRSSPAPATAPPKRPTARAAGRISSRGTCWAGRTDCQSGLHDAIGERLPVPGRPSIRFRPGWSQARFNSRLKSGRL